VSSLKHVGPTAWVLNYSHLHGTSHGKALQMVFASDGNCGRTQRTVDDAPLLTTQQPDGVSFRCLGDRTEQQSTEARVAWNSTAAGSLAKRTGVSGVAETGQSTGEPRE
jgi:hypothetical protein